MSGHARRHLLRNAACPAQRRLPCIHVFHHCCDEDVLRHARHIASHGRAAVDCMVRGSPAIVSLWPTFCYVSNDKLCSCHVHAVHAAGGASNEDDGLGAYLESWHMFALRQDLSGSSAVMQALQEDLARLAYLAFHSSSRAGGAGFAYPG